MLTLFIVLLWGQSLAEESASTEEETEVEADEEIVVYGKSEVAQRRNQLDQKIREDGYKQGIRRGNKVLYRPEIVWKPTVVVYDSGLVDLRRTPPRFEPWIQGRKDNRWRYLSCLPPFTVMCIKSGWLISKRKLQHSKTQVVDSNIESIRHWQEAIVNVATQQRLEEHIPEFLEEIWTGPSELTLQQRKEEILSFWQTRTCSSEGERAANTIADFIENEVQYSSHPVTIQEKQSIEFNHPCNRSLNISLREQ